MSLKHWSAGRVAVIGDAAHALPPNIGQGAGCSMMNALSLADHLDRLPDMASAFTAWERTERPLTAHTQRVSSSSACRPPGPRQCGGCFSAPPGDRAG